MWNLLICESETFPHYWSSRVIPEWPEDTTVLLYERVLESVPWSRTGARCLQNSRRPSPHCLAGGRRCFHRAQHCLNLPQARAGPQGRAVELTALRNGIPFPYQELKGCSEHSGHGGPRPSWTGANLKSSYQWDLYFPHLLKKKCLEFTAGYNDLGNLRS